MKTFDLSEIARNLAFNVPVVERTAPCEECYEETAVDDLVGGLCPACAEERHPDEAYCFLCRKWKWADEMADDRECLSCQQEEIGYLRYCAYAGK